jgi:SpoVK/Ycf46/Vps4 family AAA+-type ATPase
MLTKINDLRKAARSIFIIATNYENRIDPAIKRPGRIDKKYLLLQPDLAKRREILEQSLPKGDEIAPSSLNKMAQLAVCLGFEEISGVMKKWKQPDSFEVILNELIETPRSCNLNQYLAKVGRESPFPVDELIATVNMSRQAGLDIAGIVESSIDEEKKSRWDQLVKSHPKLKACLEIWS